jgi:uncharacterized protein (TIGR02001 family)
MTNLRFVSFTCLLLTVSCIPLNAQAKTSSTVTLASDYLFNGVTQTRENPALQVSLDWSSDHGTYAGIWASNVDFASKIDIELDGYLGYSGQLNEGIWFDTGLAYYSYHGGSRASDINYIEVYGAIGAGNTTVKVWYSPDYAGTDANHYVLALMQSIPINDDLSIDLQIDSSKSLDQELFVWEPDDDSYIHWKVESTFSWQGFDLAVGIEGTDLDTYGETRLIAKISRTFDFE